MSPTNQQLESHEGRQRIFFEPDDLKTHKHRL